MTENWIIQRLREAAEKAGAKRDGSDGYHVLSDAVYDLIDKYDKIKAADVDQEPYAASTIGISSGNPRVNMPAFAVDIVAGQGNGDVTDAVIALRGRILNDTAEQPVATVHFVACNWEEAVTVATALDQWAAALNEDREISPDVVDEVNHLAERYRLVPGQHAPTPEAPPVGAHVQIIESVERFPHFICPRGWTGEVVDSSAEQVSVRMYRYLGPGADEWNNEVVFHSDMVNGPLLEDFYAHCRIIESKEEGHA